MFEREAHLLLKLKHPHIARVLDRFVEEGRDYLVLEYIPGLTLRQLVQTRGKQKEKNVLNYCSKLLEILAYLHEQNPPLIHRDLTPDNIILRKDGSLCVVDFGAANELVGQPPGTMIGKQCYIAPEQLRGKAQPGKRSLCPGRRPALPAHRQRPGSSQCLQSEGPGAGDLQRHQCFNQPAYCL
ncbi:MAG: protein kinase [Candidatus Obscuribacter sp.]|nr:protein kinase [Candidatus Obscuribacter sp.]